MLVPKIFGWVGLGWLGLVRLASSRLGQVSRLGWSCWLNWSGCVDLEGLSGSIWVRKVGFKKPYKQLP